MISDYSDVTASLTRDVAKLEDALREKQWVKAAKQAQHIVAGLLLVIQWILLNKMEEK